MKRFTATEKWGDHWFRKLKPDHKVFWEFIRDNCDNSGVWKVDFEAAEFFTGCKPDPAEILAAFEGRIVDIGRNRWWVSGFVTFQCCGPLREKCVPHQKILSLLKEHGIFALYSDFLKRRVDSTLESTIPATIPARVDSTLKEEEREEEEEEEEERKGCGETIEPPPGFPASEAEAAAHAGFIGCDEDFAKGVWNEQVGRGYRDRQGHIVRSFRSVLASSWQKKEEWERRQQRNQTRPGKPPDESTAASVRKPKSKTL